MQTSKNTDKINKAMNAVQTAIPSVRVSSASFWDVVRGPLAANYLSLRQAIEVHPDLVRITTALVHVSGQKMETETEVTPASDGRIGPMIEAVAFHALLGLFALAPPNEDPAASVFTSDR